MLKKYTASLVIILLFTITFSCNNKAIISKSERSYLEENKNLNAAIYINYPPYEFVNSNGEVDGILIDYFSLLEDKIEYRFEKKFYSNWNDLITDAREGAIDIILEIQNTKERQDFLTFTEPIFGGDHIIITSKGSTVKTIKDLKNKKVAVGKAYSIEEYIKANHQDIELIPLLNEQECLKALNNGIVDAFIGLEAISNYIITDKGYSSLEVKSSINYKNELGIAINKEKPILVNIINKANNAISLEEKSAILNKWLYNLAKPFHKKTYFWRTLLFIVLGILSLSFILSYFLKKEIKNRTRALNLAKLEAENSNRLKTLFLQNVSHEVRTPLNSIIGFSSFLKESNSPETQSDYINTIQKESLNLTNILNNIIEISELTTQKKKPKFKEVSLNRELDLINEVYRVKALRKGLKFNYQSTIKPPQNCILTDKYRLTKAIRNLLDNAIKFTNKGSILLDISTEKNILKITIKDSGIGVKHSEISSIFKEFYQEEKELSKKYDGLGVGLSIANENIKSLNGNIVLEKSNEIGSIFTIKIPVEFVPNKCSSDAKPIDSTLKILIAEDMKLNYLVLSKILAKTILDKKEINWVQNGEEAIHAVNREQYDVIFMDLKMPIMNGYDATKTIKALQPDITIIAQTAYAQEQDVKKAKAYGFDAYLTKPIDSNALKITMQNLFQVKITSEY